jgi:hypothetical protein
MTVIAAAHHHGYGWGQPPQWPVVELWIALLFVALGSLSLIILMLGLAAGGAYRLFMVASGKAAVRGKPPYLRRRRRPRGPRPRPDAHALVAAAAAPGEDETVPRTLVGLDD